MEKFGIRIFLFLALATLTFSQTALPFKAHLSFIIGTVEVNRSGAGEWKKAVLNDSLFESDLVRTGEASEAEIHLSDGSSLKLREGAELQLTALQTKGAVKQTKGSVFMILKSAFSKQNPFTFTTPTATAAIRGTAFAVRLKEGQASFAVVQGSIGVLGSTGDEVAVAAGSFSTVLANSVAGIPQAIPADALKNLESWGNVKFEEYKEAVAVAPAVVEGTPADSAHDTVAKPAPVSEAAKAGAAPADQGAEKISWSLGMGSATVDGKQWSRMSLRPDIPIGNFGIGLDLEIFIDDQGNISNKGWNFDNASQGFESVQRKIYYLRYNHPGDKFYARVGALDNVTLGYGLIMYGYSNALQYPDIKKTGLNFELRDISGFGFGIQGMINNFQDFQRKGALVGLRTSIKPIKFLGIPILQNLEVGASYVSDMNQRAALGDRDGDKVPDLLDKAPSDKQWAIDVVKDTARYRTTTLLAMRYDDSVANAKAVAKYKDYIEGTDPFSIVGADVGLPILDTKLLSILTYGQLAYVIDDSSKYDSQKAEGWGFAFPGFRVGVGPLTVSLEYRHFADQFKAEYFDQTYELDRMKQQTDSTISSKEEDVLAGLDSISMNGIFGRATLNIANLLMLGASYQYMTISDDHDSAIAPTSSQEFSASAGVGETIRNILRKVKVEDVNAYYNKKNIGTWQVDTTSAGKPVFDKFLEATPSILMGYKVGFQLAPSMVLYWDNQYTYAIDEQSTGFLRHLKLVQRRNIEAVIKF